MSISLWDLHKIGDLPIQGKFYDEDAMKYKRHLKKSGCNMTTRLKGNSDLSSIIGPTGRRIPTSLRVFNDLGIASEHLEESYLAIFLACWLCKFVFPKDDVNFIRPSVFKVANRMAASKSFSLPIPVLTNIYNGLSVVSNSTSTKDCVAMREHIHAKSWLGTVRPHR
ncbi:hypothetical protein ACFX2H_029808 [Malus domestica]